MPIIDSTYNPPFWAKNGYVATSYSGLIRKVKGLKQKRERLFLEDGDFLDLDWSYAATKSDRVVVLLHGLEGNAQRPYITGTATYFNTNGFDAVAVNFRGCSGQDNLKYRTYHSGATEDLDAVVKHVLYNYSYSEIYIKGISLGANMALKYVGENTELPNELKGAVAVSVPCDLNGSCQQLLKLKNRPYAIYFLRYLKNKLRVKAAQYPERLSKVDFDSIKNLKDFDDIYTSKAHGFKDANDYYNKASCNQYLNSIKVPTLIINALNDSFLSASCFPVKEAKQNENIYLEMPKYGGHVGFIDKSGIYYNERRALEFLRNTSNPKKENPQ